LTKEKDKENKRVPREEEPDFEKMYYQVMKENLLLRNDKIEIVFTTEEINLLRLIMYEEMQNIKHDSPLSFDVDDEETERKILNKRDDDALLKTMVDERRKLIENIVKKLRFEL
jgi:hypothetical protein